MRCTEYVAGASGPTNGQTVNMWPCRDVQLNQKFNFSGAIVNDHGLCLDRRNGHNGTVPTQATRNESESQTFDYYCEVRARWLVPAKPPRLQGDARRVG